MKKIIPAGVKKQKTIAEVMAAVLILFFVHSASSNYIQLQSLKNLLAFYTSYTTAVTWAIIVIETLVTILLFIPRTRVIGFFVALSVVLYAGYVELSTPHFPHDFGGLLNSLSRSQHIQLYSLLVVLTIVGVWASISKARSGQTSPTEPVVYT